MSMFVGLKWLNLSYLIVYTGVYQVTNTGLAMTLVIWRNMCMEIFSAENFLRKFCSAEKSCVYST